MRAHQVVQIRNGVPVYNTQHAKNLLKNLEDGEYIVGIQKFNPIATTKEYRACYFAKLDILKDEVGETKLDLHTLVKEHVLVSIIKETPEASLRTVASTKFLTLIGWRILLERLDLWAFTEYNVILP